MIKGNKGSVRMRPISEMKTETTLRSTIFIVVRRVVSVFISLIGLILTLPLLPLIMLAVRLDSEGPVFYTQTRVGKAGKLFKVVKFRTMRQDAEAANGAQW